MSFPRWGRSLLIGAALIFVLGSGFASSQLVLSLRHTSAEGNADDTGPPPSSQVLTQRTDLVNGVVWRLVTYSSAAGTCVDILAATTQGQELGGPGACGPTVEPTPRPALVATPLASGGLRAPGSDGPLTWYTLVGGVVSCSCSVTVSWTDGTVTIDTAVDGFFLVYHEVGGGGPTGSSVSAARIDVGI